MVRVKIILFYIIFYIVLAALFAFCMVVLYYTLDPRIPKYKLDDSLIGMNPGLGFRPMPNDSNGLSSLIWYRGTQWKDYEGWVDKLKNFVKEYKTPGLTPGRGQNLVSCDYGQPVPEGKVCSFDVSRNFYPCVEENNFNYHLQRPCIFLKLNKIYGWRPEYYSHSEIPESMPQGLQNIIKNVTGSRLETVWLSCEGLTAADVENLGSIQYLPQPGFPGYFFPYMNNEGYLPPIVAIVLNNPKNGILLNIECKAWAKNIKHDRKEKVGMVQFEVLID
ncbi:hypothetical protein GE061_010208 [Apolygus lucorum]|uniref:Sodium/potassium-transporting ATPase subunit beta-2 n=1 Tax=Apolygus lucorum TaxID=248454 RepID=A0A8S9Y6J0_APOLU|nr:hypothetical protein GE061_010208 [Apolygus lucorum]